MTIKELDTNMNTPSFIKIFYLGFLRMYKMLYHVLMYVEYLFRAVHFIAGHYIF